MSALSFDAVCRDFVTPAGASYRAVRDVSLEISAGAFVALVGPSGCGKSTLLNMAAGLLEPSAGRVAVDGVPLTGLNRRATYMFQQDALLPWKTVRDNVALGLRLGGMARSETHVQADQWLARVGLTSFATHYPGQLSGGMRKRVSMAQNWILDRGIILMDEPFSALDVHTRQRMESELLGLWDDATGKTILFVTHDLEEAIALADRVVVLSAGPGSRVVAEHEVPLARPRDLMEIRTTASFVELYRRLWSVLKEEVVRSQHEAMRG